MYVKGGTLRLFNATVAGNQILVPSGTSYAGMGGGVYVAANGSENMENALLGNNTHRYGALPPEPDDCYGFLHSNTYNLIQTTTNCTINGEIFGNVIGQDPLLGPLQDNGGPTQTQALLADSPAIDAGDPSGCADDLGAALTTDQRGFPRPVNGLCDMGAFEYGTSPTPTPTHTRTPTKTATRTRRERRLPSLPRRPDSHSDADTPTRPARSTPTRATPTRPRATPTRDIDPHTDPLTDRDSQLDADPHADDGDLLGRPSARAFRRPLGRRDLGAGRDGRDRSGLEEHHGVVPSPDRRGLVLHGTRRRQLRHRSTPPPPMARSPPDATGSCLATANCYTVNASAISSRPAHPLGRDVHRDAVFRRSRQGLDAPHRRQLHRRAALPALLQEDRDAPAQRHHRRLHRRRPTAPATPSRAPRWRSSSPRASPAAAPTSRLSGTVGSSALQLLAGGVSLFTDVSPTDIFCKHVHYIAVQERDAGLCGRTSTVPRRRHAASRWPPSSPRPSSRREADAAVPMTYGPDPVTGLSYSCDVGQPEPPLHRRARRPTLLQARPLPLGQGHHRRLLRRRPTARPAPSPAIRWPSSSSTPSRSQLYGP